MMEQPHEVEVTIYDGITMLVTSRRPLVHLRDGRPAAVWRGLAFPILFGNRIDVAGEAWPAQETAPSANVSNPFGVIDGQSEAYVLIAGGFIDAETAAGKLRTAGFEVLRTGRYLGDPIDNLDADWFVRIVRPPVPQNLAESLAPILGQPVAPPPPMIAGDRRASLLTAELLAARSREDELRAEFVRLRLESETSLEAAAQIETLQDALAAEQQRREAAERAAAAVQRQPLPAPSGRMANEVRDVLAGLLPNINMLRNSTEVITVEFARRGAVWRVLGELARATGIPRDWKKIHGADGWWERHLSNGRDDTGRIYARRGGGAAWEVLISHKVEQNRDIAWLVRL